MLKDAIHVPDNPWWVGFVVNPVLGSINLKNETDPEYVRSLNALLIFEPRTAGDITLLSLTRVLGLTEW